MEKVSSLRVRTGNTLLRMSSIARVTVLEAVRSRLLFTMMAVVVGLFGLAEFIGELSITETTQVQVSIIASLLRVFSISIACLFVITSVLRDVDDKGLEIILSLPVPRYAYLFGKLFGFALISLFISIIACLPLFLYAPAARVGCWVLSLLCEHLLSVSLSLLCVLAFSNVNLSFLALMAFYLLSRSMETLRLLSIDPLLATGAMAQEFMHFLINALSLLLPDLHAFTRSEWLTYGSDFTSMKTVLLQTLIYLAVLLSVGLFDLYRKNL